MEVNSMRPAILGILFALVALAGGIVPAAAHHGFAKEFDAAKAVTMKGTIRRVEWKNPHTYVYIDVKDRAGSVERWALEGNPPNLLMRIGWMRDMLKPGDEITVFGYLPKPTSELAIARIAAGREVTLSDGQKLVFGIGR
jgi:hypothetical protein